MANLSTALNGVMSLENTESLTFEDFKMFLNMIEDTLGSKEMEYHTQLSPSNPIDEDTIDNITKEFISNDYKIDFEGTGRNAYSINVEMMFTWIARSSNIKHDYIKLIDKFIENNIYITLSFTDYETGVYGDRIFIGEITCLPIKENEEYKTKFIDESEDTVIANLENLSKYNYIDPEAAYYTLDGVKDESSGFKEWFDDDEIYKEWIEEYEDEFIDIDDIEYVYIPEYEQFVIYKTPEEGDH